VSCHSIFGTFAGTRRRAHFVAALSLIKEPTMSELSLCRIDRSANLATQLGAAVAARSVAEHVRERTRTEPPTPASKNASTAQKPKPKAAPASKSGAKPGSECGVDEPGRPHALVLTARATAGRLIIAHRQT
jgi:hypothetical protein